MKVLKYPVIPLTVFLALGILADYFFKPDILIVIAVISISVICFTLSYVQANKILFISPSFFITTCFLAFSTGITSHWLHYASNNSLHYSHLIKEQQAHLVKGVVTERLKPNDYYQKYYFEIASVDKSPATGKMLVSVPIDSLRTILHAGQVIIIADTPQSILKPLNPYQFDYSEYMAKQNVFHQLTLKDNFVMAGTQKNINYYVDRLRRSLSSSFDIHNFSPKVRNIINALLLGQRQDMDKATADNFTNAGVIHILAISGLHFATLFYILNLLLTPLKRFNRNGRLMQTLLILAILWTFAFITGLSASVVRSVVMFSFVAIGQSFNRNTSIFNSIAVSMLVLLLAKPNFLFDVGFQLSYAAVFAIVWLQPLYSRIRTSKYKAINYLTDTVIISLVAQIGVLPLSLYYFNQFPVLFLVANIVVIPLSTSILILGLAVLCLNFTLPALAIELGKALALAIDVMNHFIEWIASFESLVLKNIPFTLLLTITSYIVIIMFVRWMYQKNYSRTIIMLSCVIFFQIAYTAIAWRANSNKELIVFNNRKASILAFKDEKKISIYSSDSLAAQNSAILSYSKGHFNRELNTLSLKNIMFFEGRKILIIDSTGVYPENAKPDILLLTKSPKINLDRILQELKPKEVVADGTNYKSYTLRWATTCRKAGIRFHNTGKEGFFKLD